MPERALEPHPPAALPAASEVAGSGRGSPKRDGGCRPRREDPDAPIRRTGAPSTCPDQFSAVVNSQVRVTRRPLTVASIVARYAVEGASTWFGTSATEVG